MNLKSTQRQEELAIEAHQRLFNELLPDWENIIASIAFNLLNSKPIDKGLLEMKDVQNMLRMSMYQAIAKYDPDRGMALNVWITDKLHQDCALLTQAHYHKVPRGKRQTIISIKGKWRRACVQAALNDSTIPKCLQQAFRDIDLPLAREATIVIKKCCRRWYIIDNEETYTAKQLKKTLNIDQEGRVTVPIPLVGRDEEGKESYLDITDPNAEAAYEEVAAGPWFNRNTELVFRVLQNKEKVVDGKRVGLNEPKAFSMILSGKYGSDKEIAELLGETPESINFAKVGEVRFKAKIVFAIMERMSISSFTQARNAIPMAKRLRALLKPYVEDLPSIVEK